MRRRYILAPVRLGSDRLDAQARNASWHLDAHVEKYPRQMLRSRVISEGIRTGLFPARPAGVYEEAEVRDIVENNPARINDDTPPMIEHQPEAVLEETPPKKREALAGPTRARPRCGPPFGPSFTPSTALAI